MNQKIGVAAYRVVLNMLGVNIALKSAAVRNSLQTVWFLIRFI